MIKIPLFFIFGLSINYTSLLFAQNLIPNPGFEQCKKCDTRGFIELGIGSGANDTLDWNSATYGSPDIYSSFPHTGKRHGGFFTGFGKFEYLANHFTQPLVAGARYKFSFWVRAHPQNDFITDEIGVYLLRGSTTFLQSEPLKQIKPSYNTPEKDFVYPKEYVQYSFEYTACGGEDHFIVGRFNPLIEGDTLYVGAMPRPINVSQTLYYYVDDFEMLQISPPLVEDPISTKMLDLCKDSLKTLRVHENYANKNIRWNNGTTGPEIQFKNEDTIWVEIQLDDPCNTVIRDTVFIQYYKEVSLKILSSDTICTGDTLMLQALCNGECFEYVWNNQQTERIISVTQPGIYGVKVKSVCYDLYREKEIFAKKSKIPSFIQIPNVITRSGAPDNQVFKVFVPVSKKHRLFQTEWDIYNRWGQQVNHRSGLDIEWRPDANIPPDTYLYQFKAKYQDCNEITNTIVKGNFILLD